ncbi:hypothetical protein [Croceicoccus sp. Ery15]|uniref:hypothetical protein n=1 Tax=Croceicoccus sp. Ery15 TaxID=1703338 RepID=UPI001E2FD952|nr:hypothetical protein [Croceicoccus sp. Ery15]
MQNALTIIDFAQLATKTNGADVIVIECVNGGSDSRFSRNFPSIENACDLGDGPLALAPASKEEALSTFDKIVADYQAAGGELLNSTILHISAGEIVNRFEPSYF